MGDDGAAPKREHATSVDEPTRDIDPGGERRYEDREGASVDLDPRLIMLLREIPGAGQGWPADKRLRWFRTFAMELSQLHDVGEELVELKITIEDSSL